MSGEPLVQLLDGATAVDVFEVVELTGGIARVRSPYLFEVGEELKLRVQANGTTREATARVRAHVGSGDDRVTELELGEGQP